MRKQLLHKGQPVCYEMIGTGDPVMLVHGFSEDRRIWDSLLQGMESKHRWILPDLPGSGESPFNENYPEIEDFAHMLYAIIRVEQIAGLAVIGHSMGGYIALSFAGKYPDLIRRLGLFHSTSYPDSEEKIATREKNIRFIRKNSTALFVAQSIPGLFSEEFKTLHPDLVQELVDRYANFTPKSLVQYHEAMKNRRSTTAVLSSIAKPVLFILGEDDKAVPIQDGLEQCHYPRISYIHILPHTLHMGMIENTSLCNSFVDRFLDGLTF